MVGAKDTRLDPERDELECFLESTSNQPGKILHACESAFSVSLYFLLRSG